MRLGVDAVVRAITQCANTYVLAHVVDDVGVATVRGALESAGLLGTGVGQLKPHKLLFCSTLEGKVSMVRQLEPELHIDGHPSTVRAHLCVARADEKLQTITAQAAVLWHAGGQSVHGQTTET